MSNDASVTLWLDGIKTGNPTDIQRLWDRYFQPLVRLADAKMPGHARREFDEEDVALSAIDSFCGRVSRGQFPKLADRNDLWRLLVTITLRKVIDSVRHQTRQKRGGGSVLGESAFMDVDAIDSRMTHLLSRELAPELAAESAEAFERLFEKLGHPTLRTVAQLKLEGYTTEEIAAEIGTSTRTVDRKLQLIRAIWHKEFPG
jgi:DNA-directed RNA polymerase specialized sigma24 family protein